jgi:hypothetical protein
LFRAGLSGAWSVCLCNQPPLPAGTIVIAEVAHVARRQDVLNGVKLEDNSLRAPTALLRTCGFQTAPEADGRLAVARLYYFWISRVQQSAFAWAVVPQELELATGNLVEIELRTGADETLQCATVLKVRAPTLSAGQCQYRLNERSGVGAAMGAFTGALHAVGGTGGGVPGSASIYCGRLEEEGWSPFATGPYDAIVWRKLPKE